MSGLIRNLNGRQYKVGILPAKGEAKLIDFPANLALEDRVGNRTIALVLIAAGESLEIWSMPVDGKGKPRQSTDFRILGTADPRWTADGKQLLVSRSTLAMNPVLIRNSGN